MVSKGVVMKLQSSVTRDESENLRKSSRLLSFLRMEKKQKRKKKN